MPISVILIGGLENEQLRVILKILESFFKETGIILQLSRDRYMIIPLRQRAVDLLLL